MKIAKQLKRAGIATTGCMVSASIPRDRLIRFEHPTWRSKGSAIQKTTHCAPVFAIGLALSSLPVHAATFVVGNVNDSGNGSFRQAIVNANNTQGNDSIVFDIPGPGPHSIEPLSPLPVITEAVRVLGHTQPGATLANAFFAPNLQIEIDGFSAGGVANGITIETDKARIWGLVIKNFMESGISIRGSGNLVRGNHIGTTRQALAERPNSVFGVDVRGDGNQIGGHLPAHRNIISGNEQGGVNLDGDSNLVRGNFIGTDISTTVDLGNGGAGVRISGDQNLVGGTRPGDRNVISGNAIGVDIKLGQLNRIRGNIIGTDKSATVSQFIGNGVGVSINGVFGELGGNEIGGDMPGAGNVISNNIGIGVHVLSSGNRILGNRIGTDGSGAAPLGNGSGVVIHGSSNTVGGPTKATGNTVSGNGGGISVAGRPQLFSHDMFPLKPKRNVIVGNRIGTDVSGTFELGNTHNGILIRDADETHIGGDLPEEGNVISANGMHGISIEILHAGFDGTRGTRVVNNSIGTDARRSVAIGNIGSGIWIDGGVETLIGEDVRGRGNYIVGNAGDGVTVVSGTDNEIARNTMTNNAGLGIDLNADGVTGNDPLDGDSGANRSQNHLDITSANLGAASMTVNATLNSRPLGTYRVELYTAAFCDASGFGEGERFIGSWKVRTGASGFRQFTMSTAAPSGVSTGNSVTATVTVLEGVSPADTSEFSECVQL